VSDCTRQHTHRAAARKQGVQIFASSGPKAGEVALSSIGKSKANLENKMNVDEAIADS
jgi:hypothetical protein